MELKGKYYHTIMPYQSDTSFKKQEEVLYKIECLFQCGYILPYKDINEIYPEISRHPWGSSNGDERVSIALSRVDQEPYDEQYLETNKWHNIENAYEMFVLNGASIVLNEELKRRYFLAQKGIYLERQVSEPISLDYMDAISIVPTSITADYFDHHDYDGRLKSLNYLNLRFIREINRLQKEYGYQVPIVSILTGTEFNARVRKK